MKILCLILLLAIVGYSAAAVTTCEQCTSVINCANQNFDKSKLGCTKDNNDVGCYRKSKFGVLLETGCATKAVCNEAGGAGKCKTDNNDVQTCCCDKNNCNGAGFLKMSIVVLAALVSVPLLL